VKRGNKCFIRISTDLWRELRRSDRSGEGDELDIMQELLAKMGMKDVRIVAAPDYGQKDRTCWLFDHKGGNFEWKQ